MLPLLWTIPFLSSAPPLIIERLADLLAATMRGCLPLATILSFGRLGTLALACPFWGTCIRVALPIVLSTAADSAIGQQDITPVPPLLWTLVLFMSAPSLIIERFANLTATDMGPCLYTLLAALLLRRLGALGPAGRRGPYPLRYARFAGRTDTDMGPRL